MKAIIANLIVGSFAYFASSGVPAWADTLSPDRNKSKTPAILSAKALEYRDIFVLSPVAFETEPFEYSISLENKEYIKNVLQQDFWQFKSNVFPKSAKWTEQKENLFKKAPYLLENEREDLVFGKHGNFWQTKKQKYWGLTSVRTWGGDKANNLSIEQLNYLKDAPVLAPGTSALTISGGSKKNLVEDRNNLLGEVTDFQGGIAFHQSVADEVTLGLGFVYEDFLLGFSQLTYQPENFPMRTTVSLLQGKEGIEFHSHLQLQPAQKMVLNVYADEKDQKFDFNWGLISGLKLTADGSSETESLRAGAEVKFENELFSFLAKAQLDHENKIHWQVNSQLGNFKLKYTTNAVKTKTEVKYDFDSFQESGFQLAIFFKSHTRQRRKKEESLAIWGIDVYSPEKIGKNNPRWEFSFGYGSGLEGSGAIASMGAAMSPSLSLKLSYEEVSLTSDETKVKLQLRSH